MRFFCLAAVLAIGCGSAEYGPMAFAPEREAPMEAAMMDDSGGMEMALAEEAVAAGELPEAKALERKIIYTAELNLVVEDFTPVPAEVENLIKQFDGYIARSNLYGSPGRPRTGSWTIRVPADRFKDFLAAARKIGEVRNESSDSQDVSEEFYDLQARIRNKKHQEDRLLKILDDEKRTGKLKDVLDVEREIARVREEIERMEGRIRVINDLTSMTTVTLSVEEVKDYVPEESPTYFTRVRREFSGSINALVSTADAISIFLIVVAPWLGVLLVVIFILWAILRLGRKRRKKDEPEEAQIVPEE